MRTYYVYILANATNVAIYTGVTNENILQNFHTLCQSSKPFVVRTPLIPGVTDTESNLTAIAMRLQKEGISSIDLLAYNKMAGGKYASVGRLYAPSFDETVPYQAHPEIFVRHGITPNLL